MSLNDNNNTSMYELHGLKTMVEKDNAFQLIVKGSDFYPYFIQAKTPDSTIPIVMNSSSMNQFYLGQEMLDTAMMTAYYCGQQNYIVHVQRIGKEIGVVSVGVSRRNTYGDSPNGSNPSHFTKNNSKFSLLGADIEVMVYDHIRKSFAAMPMSDRENSRIGSDRALIRKGTSFYQPIIELRAIPQASGIKLLRELLSLKEKLEDRANKFNLKIIANSNPTGRFFIGGHIHISNQTASFHKASQLDALLTLPISAYLKKGKERRNFYGRLGSVRLNPYNGFEYRTLPSWYDLISEDNQPLFDWIEFLLFHENLPYFKQPENVIRAYYEDDTMELKKVVSIFFRELYEHLNDTERDLLEEWINWLKMKERID